MPITSTNSKTHKLINCQISILEPDIQTHLIQSPAATHLFMHKHQLPRINSSNYQSISPSYYHTFIIEKLKILNLITFNFHQKFSVIAKQLSYSHFCFFSFLFISFFIINHIYHLTQSDKSLVYAEHFIINDSITHYQSSEKDIPLSFNYFIIDNTSPTSYQPDYSVKIGAIEIYQHLFSCNL